MPATDDKPSLKGACSWSHDLFQIFGTQRYLWNDWS